MFKIGDSFSIKRKETECSFSQPSLIQPTREHNFFQESINNNLLTTEKFSSPESINVFSTSEKFSSPEDLNNKLIGTKKLDNFQLYNKSEDLNNKLIGTKKLDNEPDVYEDNRGTTLALIVKNKLIVAADTRLSAEYNIYSRKMSKIYKIGNIFFTTTGFYADGFEVYNKLLYEIKQYETYANISIKSAAHLLFNILYSRRFFPYYTFSTLSGFENINDELKPVIYSFDCVGNYQPTFCRVDGSGAKMLQPLLDSRISGKNFIGFTEPSFEEAFNLVKKGFDSVAEVDVKTKDVLEIYVADGENVDKEIIHLRKD